MFGKDVQSKRQKFSSTYKALPVESYSLHPKGKIRVTLLKSICKDKKGRVIEERVVGLVRQYQASLQTAPTHLHSYPQSLSQKTENNAKKVTK